MRSDLKVQKRDRGIEDFKFEKILKSINESCKVINYKLLSSIYVSDLYNFLESSLDVESGEIISSSKIRDFVEDWLNKYDKKLLKSYKTYNETHKNIRTYVKNKEDFIKKYKASNNNADATVDDNSNVGTKNIGTMNSEIHKSDNIEVLRGMMMRKLEELYPDFDKKQYIRDLESHIIYKHDESSFSFPAPYCVSITMYPFLLEGLKGIGGTSSAPHNLDSYCGGLVNLIFTVSSMYAGAVAVSEALLYFDYFARKEWGDDYYIRHDDTATLGLSPKTIQEKIHQYFQGIIYSINQPSGARNCQAAFVNFSYFDKPFFDGMFGEFIFPDGTKPQWESLCWLQKDFMQWFNNERLKTLNTFPVESFALVYKDGKFLDQESADFVAAEYARGHSFFTYISDTVDSLSSCCRLKNKIQTKEFNFTNGNMGIQTGSKSVITLNLNRLIQDAYRKYNHSEELLESNYPTFYDCLNASINKILERVYKYHTAYNELLWEMYDSNLLPVYKAGFIDLNKQYLTIGINGLNEAAEFLGLKCSDNEEYAKFCQTVFSVIKECNQAHNGKFNKHQLTFNCECVPAESLAIKNYNWDKADGYWVPDDRNLYASYIFKPSDKSLSVLDKIRMHGSNYIGEYLDGGSAAHLNLAEHLSKIQYKYILEYAAENGCQYLTFNVPNSECADCGFITKRPITECPHCGSKKINYYDRVIGYLTKISNWSTGRQIEQKTRDYTKNIGMDQIDEPNECN